MTTVSVPFTFTEGWGVSVALIYAGEDDYGVDREAIADLEVGVARIAADTVYPIGNIPCVPFDHDTAGDSDYPVWVPVELFKADLAPVNGDSHDARSHWFATEAEARDHAKTVAEQWANPLPWQAFIQTDDNA